MKQLSLEEVKRVQLEILDAVHKYCLDNNCTYYLTGGTLIGAIRHEGYIPWDDDIDIMMLRDDYNSFVNGFNNSYSTYKVYTCFNDSRMNYPFAKISDERTVMYENTNQLMPPLGVSIDLFPIDYLPASTQKINLIICVERLFKQMIGVLGMEKKSRGLSKNVLFLIVQQLNKMIDLNSIAKVMNNIAEKCGNSNSLLCADLVWGYSEKEIVPKSVFNKAVPVSFEGCERFIPIGYDTFLSSIYGNYMELPPVEERVAHHTFTAFYK